MTRRAGKRFAFLKRQSYARTAGTLLRKELFGFRVSARPAAPAPIHKGSHGKTKYGSRKDTRGELRFDSKKEARRYDELMVMLRAGIISDLRLQPQFTLQESYITETGERIRAIRYTADFSYKFGGKLVVEDVKSKPTRTKEYLRNRKFMRSKFGIEIQEV